MTPPTTYAVDCGTVTTTAHADGSGGPVELAVAVVYSNGARVAQDPVVYLDGGPGAASIQSLLRDSIPFTSVLEDHDLVLFDQRGTGFSTPRPDCNLADTEVMTLGPPASDGGVTPATDGGSPSLSSEIARCRTEAEGLAELSMFRSSENAADVVAVQRALGYGHVTLYGISYGTRYALTVLRDHPANVTSAVIDSVVPLQVDLISEQGANVYHAIHLVGTACSGQSSCVETYGDVESKELAVLERMSAKAPSVTLGDGSTVTVQASIVASLLVNFLYSPETISLLPELVQELSDGDYSALAVLSSANNRTSSVIDTATYLSVTCADEAPFSSPAALEQGLAAVPAAWRKWVAPSSLFDTCRVWDVPASPEIENQAVTSAIPTLVASGRFDPVTPPSYGALAATTLSRSRVVVFDGEAHGSTIGACGELVLHEFLNDPSGAFGDSCEADSRLAFQSLGAREPGGAAIRFDTSRRRPSDDTIEAAVRRFPFPIFR
ncbi:MAG TPA: alpha/beta fold hydrolase [Polyangiaceae bacterium]|nr:alpha/beta fold hydrolase [Polyangiaceae bacterium]